MAPLMRTKGASLMRSRRALTRVLGRPGPRCVILVADHDSRIEAETAKGTRVPILITTERRSSRVPTAVAS